MMKTVLSITLSLIILSACTEGLDNGTSTENPSNQSLTKGPMCLTLEKVTATTVSFTAKLDIDMMADFQEVGLLYSQDENLDIENPVVKKVKINKECYDAIFTGLPYKTDYYYTIYTLRNNIYSYGDTQAFKTKDVSINVEDISATAISATMTGTVERDELDESIDLGIEWSINKDFTSLNHKIIAKPDETGKYSIVLSNLSFGTEYYYRKFVCQNNKYEYRDTSSFTTSVVEMDICASDVTQTKITFTGNVNIPEEDDIEVGVVYSFADSTPDINSTSFTLKEYISEDGNILCLRSGFIPSTHYYYRYYIKQNSGYVYGEVQEFTTEDVDISINIGNITQTTAILSGHYLIEPDKFGCPICEIGVICKRNGEPTENDWDEYIHIGYLQDVENNAQHNFQISIAELLIGSTYQYRYRINWPYRTDTYDGFYYDHKPILGEIQEFTTQNVPITINVDNITQTTATFTGNISLTEKDTLEVGLLCSSSTSDPKATTNDVSKIILTDLLDENGDYSYKAEKLLHGTTHYYRYYVKQEDTYTYGEVYSLKTETVTEIAISMDNTQRNRATFKGNVKFSEPNEIQIGVQYYPKSASHRNISIVNRIADNGDFSLEISDLSFGTEYYWKPILIQNGKTFSVGGLQEFYVGAYNMSDAVDLTSTGCANCYIVSQKGLYKLKAVKGNSNDTVGDVATCGVLWESFGTSTTPNNGALISNISYEDGYIAFQTVDNFTEGNAVIAARDADEVILWSWHIWFTDYPLEQVYYNNAGIMMDRNLGATSAIPGDAGALGLLYQWGRKDPFLRTSQHTTISVTTINYSIAHPTIFITCDGYTIFDDHWCRNEDAHALWIETPNKKTTYDPCPAGWRVPDGGESNIWSRALNTTNFSDIKFDNQNLGINFYGKLGKESNIWYPAAGYLTNTDGRLTYSGYGGKYWSAKQNYYLHLDADPDIRPDSFINCAAGLSIRCAKE